MIIAILLIAYVVVAPLIGCILLEYFEFYSYSSGQTGYYNGSWYFYLINSIILIIFTYLTFKIKVRSIKLRNYFLKIHNESTLKIVISLVIFSFIILFFFGGYKTIVGAVNKGEFRSKEIGVLGLGFMAFLISKFLAPSLLCYLTLIYKYQKVNKILLFFSYFIVSMIGFSWGFKSFAIVILLPAFIILFYESRIKESLKLAFFSFPIILFSALYYDKELLELYGINPIQLILLRMTVIEGDAYWTIFGKVLNGEVKPLYIDYFKYFLSGLGNKIVYFFGLDISNPYIKIEYFLTSYINYLTHGDIHHATSGEHNVTATFVSEGLLFLGTTGIYFFSAFAGVLTGLNLKLVKKSILTKKWKIASISCTSYVMLTWSWLKGGDLTTIFHISNLLGIIMTYYLLLFIEKRIRL